MDFRDTYVLIIGMGKSGTAVKEALLSRGAQIQIYDKNHQNGAEPEDMGCFDLAVVSPGVPLSVSVVKRARDAGVPVIGELELAYRMAKGSFIAITGTNGKTTTTTLVYEIFKEAGKKAKLVGNIGTPAVSQAGGSEKDTWLVTEVSSFQLESICDFRPFVSAVLNITPDHLDRHGTFEAYIKSKGRIYKNQKEADWCIINIDDEPSRGLVETCRCRVAGFSRKCEPETGAFVKNGRIVVRDEKKHIYDICNIADLKIPGSHNLENALAASAIAFFAGITPGLIAEAIKRFEGVEHRLEFACEVGGVRFVNDSKGTNPDASIKAVEAMTGDTILIAGGYDKNADYEQWISSFGDTVKHLVLLGKTAEKIKKTAQRLGYTQITMAKDMRESVETAYQMASPGDTVLLSPACASWDMYSCFEERGEDFKTIVKELVP